MQSVFAKKPSDSATGTFQKSIRRTCSTPSPCGMHFCQLGSHPLQFLANFYRWVHTTPSAVLALPTGSPNGMSNAGGQC